MLQTDNMHLKKVGVMLLLFMLCLLLFLPKLWMSSQLTYQDEYKFYFTIPIYMLHNHHLILPYYLHHLRLRKPPLINWLTAISFTLFGISIFAARLVAVLFAILAIFATYQLTTIVEKKLATLVTLITFTFIFFAIAEGDITPVGRP